MKARVKSLADYETRTANDDCMWFLNNIQAITMQFDERHHHGYTLMLNAVAGLVNCRQQPEQSVTSYLEALKSHVDTVEYHGGTLVLNLDLAPETALDGTKLSETERKKIARDSTLAAALIRGADRTRFGTLQTNLLNQYSNGKDEYPTDLTSAYGMLATYQTPSNLPRPPRAPQSSSRNPADDQSVSTHATAPHGGQQRRNFRPEQHRCARHQRRAPRRDHMLPVRMNRSLRMQLPRRSKHNKLRHDTTPRRTHAGTRTLRN